MHAHALHSQAVEADMFGDMPDVQAGQQLQFRGILLRNAVIRTKPAADGLHSVPVVCMELKSTLDIVTHTCYAELPFTDSTRKQAEDLAKTLTKGREVTVFTPVADMRLVFPHVNSISFKKE